MDYVKSGNVLKPAQKIIIPGELPSLNEIIDAAKLMKPYIRMKRGYTDIVGYSALKHEHIENPVEVWISWITKDEKKDPDNVAAGVKFILDGLKEAGVITNDTRKFIKRIVHDFPKPDKSNPRVEVELREVS